MTIIGSFTRTKSGYSGGLRTLMLDLALVLVSADRGEAEKAPDYRIHLDDEDGPDVGAGWKRRTDKAGDYVALVIDDPMLTQPIRANLFQSGDDKSAWSLHWVRPARQSDNQNERR